VTDRGGALDYRSAGVDIDAADDAKGRLKRLVASSAASMSTPADR